jgi:uncharacterized protein (DUF1015 family)
MSIVRPFRALRPPQQTAARIAAVPYDVVNTAEARELATDNPLSFLHVSRPEIDLPDDTNPYADEVYVKAGENFEKLKAAGPLMLEEERSLYIYRLRMGSHSQTGIAGCCSIAEYDAGTVRKHERTRKDKEDDRTRHMVELRAQTGPVFLTYRGRDEIDRIVARSQNNEPLYDFTAPDSISHTIWRLDPDDTGRLEAAFNSVPLLYIADGHHRAASAARARDQLKENNSSHTGSEEYNFFLAVVFPANQLQILAYNRVVKELNGLSNEQFIEALSTQFDISEAASAVPTRKGEICAYVGGRWYDLKLPRGTTNAIDPIAALDVTMLQERLLEPALGITDLRTDKRIDFVGGIRGTAALEQMVNEGRAAAAFSMYPVTVDELMAVADQNEIMPPKSTWFEPKLRDGLLIHVI